MDENEINRTLFPQRKNLMHRCAGSVNDAEIYFVTVCSKNRVANLGHEKVHVALRRAWLDGRHWLVYSYVIMPDHIHLIVARASGSSVSLRRWVGWWKRQCLLEVAEPYVEWQKGCWDTRVRSDETLLQKWQYIRDNPVRSALVRQVSDWPFVGNLHRRR